jgi:ABC-type hemin transport system ATPase subunit
MTLLAEKGSLSPEAGAACFLTRVRIRNYKSIGKCDASLYPLTVLVGRNGSGKSNFLDALRFVTEALHTSLDHAIKSRGGHRRGQAPEHRAPAKLRH